MLTLKRNIKINLEYDGTRFSGWQRQGNSQDTIQGTIEKHLFDVLGEEVEVTASGRTDAGVHAYNQVANFITESNLDVEKIKYQMNNVLPRDIAIKDIEETTERFHARYNAKSKKYLYRIWNDVTPNVFLRKFSYFYPNQINIQSMKLAASYFVGTHDFKSFCTKTNGKKSTVRTIYDIEITKNGSEMNIVVHGDGFLYNMVRIIVGTLLDAGIGKINPKDIEKILLEKERQSAGITVPPNGLFLMNVIY